MRRARRCRGESHRAGEGRSRFPRLLASRALPALAGALILLAGLEVPATPVRAAVTVSAEIQPGSIPAGGRAEITVTIDGAARIDEPPSIPPVRGLRIQRAGQQTNVSIINGRMSRSVSYQFLVEADAPGRYSLGPVVVKESGKLYRSRPLSLDVAAGSSPGAVPPGSAAPGPAPPGSAPPGSMSPGNASPGVGGTAPSIPNPSLPESAEQGQIFVEAAVDRNDVYLGEQVTLRFRFYQDMGFPVLETRLENPPSTQGFWREDLPPQRTSQKMVGGRPYQVTEIVYALFPTQDGDLEIGPGVVQCEVRDRRRRGGDPFNLFGSFFGQRTVELRSRPVKIHVRPLPKPAPEDFTGGVGSYRLEASLDRTEVPQNEYVTLTLSVRGTGNVSAVGNPSIPDLGDFRTYPPVTDVVPDLGNDRVGGEKKFDIVLIPQATGRRLVPPITLSVFDPAAGQYERLSSDSLFVRVLPAANVAGGTGGEVTRVGWDLRTIRDDTRLRAIGSDRVWNFPGFWAVQIAPVLLLGFAWLYRRRRDRIEANWIGVLSRKAPGRFRAELRALRSDRRAEPAERFGKLDEIVVRFLTERYGYPVRGRTREELAGWLEERGVKGPAIAELRQILERCDFARFAPQTQTAEGFEETWRQAAELPRLLDGRSRGRIGTPRRTAGAQALLWIAGIGLGSLLAASGSDGQIADASGGANGTRGGAIVQDGAGSAGAGAKGDGPAGIAASAGTAAGGEDSTPAGSPKPGAIATPTGSQDLGASTSPTGTPAPGAMKSPAGTPSSGGIQTPGGTSAAANGGSPSGMDTGVRTREEARQTFREGNEAYRRQDYRAAIEQYDRVLDGGFESPDLWLNLGNAYYRRGDVGRAVYHFERGRRLDPTDPDLSANLELALRGTKDHAPEVDSNRFLRLLVTLQDRVPLVSSLRWLSVAWWLFALWLGARVALRPERRYFGALGVLLAAVLLCAAGWTGVQLLQRESRPDGVVVAEELPVRSNPDSGATVEFTLHAGTTLRLGREAPGFREVIFSDQLQGWADADGVLDL